MDALAGTLGSVTSRDVGQEDGAIVMLTKMLLIQLGKPLSLFLTHTHACVPAHTLTSCTWGGAVGSDHSPRVGMFFLR